SELIIELPPDEIVVEYPVGPREAGGGCTSAAREAGMKIEAFNPQPLGGTPRQRKRRVGLIGEKRCDAVRRRIIDRAAPPIRCGKSEPSCQGGVTRHVIQAVAKAEPI